MTTKHEGLPPELVFEADGHVSELGLACVADGESALLPAAALAHLDRCEPCGRRLGEATLLSLVAGEALAVAVRRVRRPLPIAAIAAAAAILAVTAGPAVVEAVRGVPGLIVGVVSWLPAMARVGGAFVRSEPAAVGPWLFALKTVSALLLLVMAFKVARVTARVRSFEGGVR